MELLPWILLVGSGLLAVGATMAFHTRVWIKPKGVLSIVKWLLSLIVFFTAFVLFVVLLGQVTDFDARTTEKTVALIQQQSRVSPDQWSTVEVVCGYYDNEEAAESKIRCEAFFRRNATGSELHTEYGSAGAPKLRVRAVTISKHDLEKACALLKFPEEK